MRILVDIGHPAHVHLFRNFINVMEKRGNRVLATIRDRENVRKLLDYYQISYLSLGEYKKTISGKIGTLLYYNKRLYSISKKFRPDIFLSHGSMYAAHVSTLLSKPHISFEDTEHSTEQIILYKPFTDVILTSYAFERNLGKKQVRYHGYHELAYLHPKYYTKDLGILDLLGLDANEKYIIIRFVSWSATHDLGVSGLSLEMKRNLVHALSKYAKVFITSEGSLPNDLEEYRLTFSPEKVHDALSSASLYIGEGATMASECAVLGTPGIYVNSLNLGYINEQIKYGLVVQCKTFPEIIETAKNWLKNDNLKDEFKEKRDKMLADKNNLTDFLLDFVDSYKLS